MFALFVEGGAIFMSILTIILLALLLAAWKAPAWVKEIGIIALVWGVFGFLMGMYMAGVNIERIGSVAQHVLWGGIKCTLIPMIYGLIIYLVSLIIRIIQKPRI
jgi:hypothetical protein